MNKGRFVPRLRALVLFLLPTSVARLIVGRARIARQVRIGWSWVEVDRLDMEAGSHVGHGSFVRVPRLALSCGSWIGHLNIIKGPVAITLGPRAAIGNRNHIVRSVFATMVGDAELVLGEWSKITAGHYIDCAQTVRFGDFATLGGIGSHIWTHGFVHETTGLGRYRVDGAVTVGNNVYIGARASILAGVTIAPAAIVGAGTVIARDLTEPGFYIAGPVRMLPRPAEPDTRSDLTMTGSDGPVRIYRKT